MSQGAACSEGFGFHRSAASSSSAKTDAQAETVLASVKRAEPAIEPVVALPSVDDINRSHSKTRSLLDRRHARDA